MPRLNRDLWFFYASLLLFSVANGAYMVSLPAYARELGASPVELGVLGSVGMAFSTVAALPGGWLADRFDRKLLMVIGWAMCIPVPLIFAAAQTWQQLIPGYALFHLSLFSNPAMQAYIASKADPGKAGFTFSFVFSSLAVGAIAAPPLGGWLAETVGLDIVFYISAVVYFLSTAAILFMSKDKPATLEGRGAVTIRSVLTPQLVRHLLLFMLVMTVVHIPFSFITPYMQEVAGYDLARIGLLTSAAALGRMVISPFYGRVADRRGTLPAISYILLAVAAAYGMMIGTSWLPIFVLSFFLRGSSDGLNSLMASEIGRISSRAAAGMSFALFGLCTNLGSTVAPYLGGQLYALAARWPFALAAALALLLSAYFIWNQSRQVRSLQSRQLAE